MMAVERPSKDESVIEKAELSRAGSNVRPTDLDVRVQQLAKEAPPFYRNRNLLRLYLLMIPGCLVPAFTLGFDASMMNGLEAVGSWEECESPVAMSCRRQG
jgi:hypothetical protein